MSAITQSFMVTFESELQHRMTSAWNRALKRMWWNRIMSVQTSSTLEEIIEWQISKAAIHKLGIEGAKRFYADLASQQFKIVNNYWGEALKLSRQKLNDNKYDLAVQWAGDIGKAAAFFPQRKSVELIKNGKTKKGYDGVNFFATTHPVDPSNSAAGTYKNLFTTNAAGNPFDLTGPNLAEAFAYIEAVPMADGVTPRYLEGTQLIVPGQLKLTADTLTGAQQITDPLNSTKGASADNMLAAISKYGFLPPIVEPMFNAEPHVWYLAVPVITDEEAPMRGSLVYQEREPFTLSTFSDLTDAQLSRVKQFEWSYEGRAEVQYGDPFLLYRFEGTPPA
jgi:phage major head subunit gpT-like protein